MAGNAPHRSQVTVFSGTLTTDVTATKDATYTGRRISSLHPPYVLTMNVADSGTTQGGTTYAISLQIYDSADGTTYNAVSGFTTGSLGTTGSQSKRKATGEQLRRYVQARASTGIGTYGSGVTITGVLTGEGAA